jgi:hypothetical protein
MRSLGLGSLECGGSTPLWMFGFRAPAQYRKIQSGVEPPHSKNPKRCRATALQKRTRTVSEQLLVALLLTLGVGGVRADEPPLRNRPPRFNGAVGSFDISTDAKPTTLHLDETLTLTVRITATGPVQRPPTRPDLRDEPKFVEKFHIEALPVPDDQPADRSPWEFVYRLKPRDAKVDAVPSLPFVFYRPGSSPTARGAYQTVYTKHIPLTVKPPKATSSPAAPKPIEAPEWAWQITEGEAVLHRPAPSLVPGVVVALLVLLAMPGLSAVWYLVWRRRYPAAARLAALQRSEAARQALHSLRSLHRLPPEDQPRQAGAAVTTYLRQRIALSIAEPTAVEVAAALRGAGGSEPLAGEVARFFREADEARFAPGLATPVGSWEGEAVRLVLALEGELWPSPPS